MEYRRIARSARSFFRSAEKYHLARKTAPPTPAAIMGKRAGRSATIGSVAPLPDVAQREGDPSAHGLG
jgi:hypothetical protein